MVDRTDPGTVAKEVAAYQRLAMLITRGPVTLVEKNHDTVYIVVGCLGVPGCGPDVAGAIDDVYSKIFGID